LGVRIAGRGAPGTHHRVIVVDKENGAVKEEKAFVGGQGWFQWFTYDRQKGEYELGGYNQIGKLRIYAPPSDAKK
jgi:hypothetical protein